MLSEADKRNYLAKVLNPNLGYLIRKALRKQILDKTKKVTVCQHCGDLNGNIKKSSLLKIVHEKYKAKKKIDTIVQDKLAEYSNVLEDNKALEGILQNGLVNILNPLEVKKKIHL